MFLSEKHKLIQKLAAEFAAKEFTKDIGKLYTRLGAFAAGSGT